MNSQAANDANHRGGSLVTLSSKRVGPATNPRTLGVPKPPRSASRSQSVTLLIFRTIGVIIIIISLIWFYLLYRIVSDFGGLKPSSEVVRPPVFNPHDVNRLEWLLKMKLESNAPLLDLEMMDSPVLRWKDKRTKWQYWQSDRVTDYSISRWR
jgi:hypothetical protein